MKSEKLPGISSSANLYQIQTQPNQLGATAVQVFWSDCFQAIFSVFCHSCCIQTIQPAPVF